MVYALISHPDDGVGHSWRVALFGGVGQSGHGSECFFLLFILLVFSMVLIVVALTSLVVLVSLVFPIIVDVFKFVHCMFKRVPGNN